MIHSCSELKKNIKAARKVIITFRAALFWLTYVSYFIRNKI